MIINQISKDFAVSPQIKVTDIASLKELGFNSIICNRPDGEELNQTSHNAIEKEANLTGIRFCYLPVLSTDVSQEAVTSFRQLLEHLPTPVLAYCRTGTRSAVLWSFGQVEVVGLVKVLSKTQKAGYDLNKELQRQALK